MNQTLYRIIRSDHVHSFLLLSIIASMIIAIIDEMNTGPHHNPHNIANGIVFTVFAIFSLRQCLWNVTEQRKLEAIGWAASIPFFFYASTAIWLGFQPLVWILGLLAVIGLLGMLLTIIPPTQRLVKKRRPSS